MASSSSHSPHIKRFHVFPSFHGSDVRRRFLSHLHTYFANKGITLFKDQEIERGHSIGPELVKAIRESRISVVLLSKNYASSSWCLDELVEILKCKEALGQIVMTIFYEVDPSDVRKQKGDFGSAFMKTCQGKTEEVKQSWSKALTHVANIEGEHSVKWANESDMIQKIAVDVSNKLNVTLSRDFDDMVGLQAHLRKVNSLLCIERDDEVKMIGIWGPAGIGKTTIARALFNQLSREFQLRCFMGNLRGGSYRSIVGVDDYGSKLELQNQLLSNILDQRDMRIHHLGAIKERLQDQRVLIILDDVDDLEKLDALARELSWFGFGSRIIVTTQDKKILVGHGIDVIYNVDFPSREEALEILCLSAFRQRSVRDGFEEVASRVAWHCGNLPLGLCVVGSSLRGESKEEWELQLSSRMETSIDRKIEDVLRVGYDRLLKKDQDLFLHIACFFNRVSVDYVTSMFAGSNLDVGNGLKTLAVKSLVQITLDPYYTPSQKRIEMHSLLEQMGRQVVHEQSDEPGKCQFLLESQEIRDVLTNETGTGSVIGITLHMYLVGKFSISGRAFERMPNLRFLSIYGTFDDELQISENMEYLPRLRLLHWDFYPRKRLPPTFQAQCLVELSMRCSNLEKLWDGIQSLPNLKKMDLSCSHKLKEIPNLSKATNLELLTLTYCSSLVELTSSIRNLHKLKELDMSGCVKLRVIPTNINLASLERVYMSYCSQLRSFPDFSSNIKILKARDTKIKDIPASIVGRWSRLYTLEIGSRSLKRLTHVPKCVTWLDLSNSDIKTIPDCVSSLPGLRHLIVKNCRKLVSLQSLPPSLLNFDATDCRSLKSVCCSFDEPKRYIALNNCKCVKSEKDAKRITSATFYHPTRQVEFHNCLSLGEEARRVIIQRWDYEYVCLPGKQVPAYFTHKAKGNSITISEGTFSPSSIFKACLLLSSTNGILSNPPIVCRLRSNGVLIQEHYYHSTIAYNKLLTEHLLVFSGAMFTEHICVEVDATTSEILFEFSCEGNDDMITECGVLILAEEYEIKVSYTFDDPNREVKFRNCLSLDEEARRVIIQRWVYKYVFLPGKQIPSEFTHRAKGNSVTISEGTFFASTRFKACLLLSPNLKVKFGYGIVCRLRSKGVVINEVEFYEGYELSEQSIFPSFQPYPQLLTEHLLVFPGGLFKEHICLEEDAITSEIQFEFSCKENDDMIIECHDMIIKCGVQMLADEVESSSNKWKEKNDEAVEVSKDGWWSWLKKLCLSKKKKESNSRGIS